MRASLYLAWRYIHFNAVKSAILVVVLGVIAVIPLAVERLAALAEAELLRRAETTPLLYGAQGSPLDLSMSALYFDGAPPRSVTMADLDALAATQLAQVIPLHREFSARGHSIVGTDLDYFDFRGLSPAEGRLFAWLGECVLGADVAAGLGLRPGDTLLSETDNLFRLAGAYPLKMQVVGVLAPSGTADDRAVFTSLATAWVVAGLAHGHQDLARTTDESVVLRRGPEGIVANAKLTEYVEVTPENRDSFHFHGDSTAFPVSAVLVAPHDAKNAAILLGRVQTDDTERQLFRPIEIVEGLLEEVFRIKSVLELITAAVGAATIFALGLIVALSLRLRTQEFEVTRRIGGDRAAMVRLVGAELLILAGAAAILCLGALGLIEAYGERLVRALIFTRS